MSRSHFVPRWRRPSLYLWWLAAALVIILASYVVLARQLMAWVPDYREPLLELLEERLQTPLEIADLQGELVGVVPRFIGRDIRLPGPQGKAPLQLDKVVAELDVLASLWRRDLVLRSLHVQGVAVQLSRDEDGKVHLRGLEHLGGESDSDAQLQLEDWLDILYRQRQIVIEDVRFSLQWPGLPELAASRLDAAFVQTRAGPRLSLTVEARDRPLAVEARLHLNGQPRSRAALEGDLYLQVAGERLQEWLPHQRDWPLDLQALSGTVSVWGSVQAGELRRGQLDLQVPTLVLSDGLQRWPLSQLQLAADFVRGDEQARVAIQSLNGESPAGTLRLGQLAMEWQTVGEQRAWQGRAEDLTIHGLAQQLLQWPFALPDGLVAVRERMQQLQPRGVLQGAYWQGQGSQVEQFQLRVTGLYSRAEGALPGVQGLNGWLAGGPDQGIAQIYGENLQLALGGLYGHALQGQVTGLLAWQRDQQGVELRSNRIQVINEDARGEAMLALSLPADEIPQLRLMARISDGDGSQAARYIPLKPLNPALADWLTQAFKGGRLQQGQLLYQGPVRIDPQRQQDRSFLMRYQGEDVQLSFLPDWPQVSGIHADVLINGPKVSGVASQARFLGSEGRQIHVDIAPHRQTGVPVLVLSGSVAGPGDDLDTLLQRTPLAALLPDELRDWRFAGGQLQGQLLLSIPLAADQGPPTVIVDGQAQQLRVENLNRRITLEQVRAPVYFHLQDGIQIERFSADAMGASVRGQWHTRQGRSRLQLEGDVPVAAVRQWLAFPWLAPLSGTMPLGLELELPWQGQRFSLQVASSLRGVQVDLPAPMGKPADESRPLAMTLSESHAGQRLQLRYGDRLRAAFLFDPQLRGELVAGIGPEPRVPEQGINLRGQVDALSAQPWLSYISEQLLPSLSQQPSETAAVLAPGQGLNRVTVAAERLDLFGLPIPNATFSALPGAEGSWTMAVSSAALAGSMIMPADFSHRGETPLELSVSRLDVQLDEQVLDEGGGPLVRPRPRDLPTMDVRLQGARINGEDYGQWRGDVRPTESGIRVRNLNGLWRDTRIEGELQWRSDEQGEEQYSQLSGRLSSTNLAATLQAWELPVFVEAEDAAATVVLGWHDWPLALDYLALEGQARLDVGECRIPETDSRASLLRVLGILNVGTIQRRLRLDFSDLYKRGLSCDGIRGDFSIDGPLISTANLTIDSPSAVIRARGDVDLAAQTLDHELQITLPLSSNLYAGCLAGPAACAGIFVVERIWGDRLDKTTTLDYRVRGPLQDPRVSERNGES